MSAINQWIYGIYYAKTEFGKENYVNKSDDIAKK